MIFNQSIYQSIKQLIKEKLTKELHVIYNSYQALVSITEAKHKNICPDFCLSFKYAKTWVINTEKNVLHVYRLMLMLIE